MEGNNKFVDNFLPFNFLKKYFLKKYSQISINISEMHFFSKSAIIVFLWIYLCHSGHQICLSQDSDYNKNFTTFNILELALLKDCGALNDCYWSLEKMFSTVIEFHYWRYV